MKILLNVLGGLAALVLLLVVVAFFLPRSYRVERTTVIKAKPEAVFPLIADLRRWKDWGAWQERDPGMQLSYSANATGVGAWSAWISASEGSGKMTLTAVEPAKRIAYNLEFPDMGTSSRGTLTLEPAAGGVKVVWADAGDLGMNPLFRWFGLFLEKMIGPDFERGLAKLKTLAEAPAK